MSNPDPSSKSENNGGLGLVLGSSFGVLIGSITGQMGLWICIGTAMGICFGSAFSSNASED